MMEKENVSQMPKKPEVEVLLDNVGPRYVGRFAEETWGTRTSFCSASRTNQVCLAKATTSTPYFMDLIFSSPWAEHCMIQYGAPHSIILCIPLPPWGMPCFLRLA